MDTAPATTPEVAPVVVDLTVVDKNPEIVSLVKKSGLEAETAHSLAVAYSPFFAEVDRLLEDAKAVDVTDATQVTMIKKARELRIALAKQRTGAEKKKDELKADSLRRSNAIQGFYNILKFMTEPIEEKLLKGEKFAELAEAKRLASRREARLLALKPFGVDPAFYDLLNMPDDSFAKLLDGTKAAFEAAENKKKADEEARIAKEKEEADERERVRAENERLKNEASQREIEAKLERERVAQEKAVADAERKRLEDKAITQKAEFERKEQEARDRTERELADIRKRNEETARAERERRDAEAAVEQKKRDAEAADREKKHKEQVAALKKKADDEAAARKSSDEKAASVQREATERFAANRRLLDEQIKRDEQAVAAEAEQKRALAAAPDKEKLAHLAAAIRSLHIPGLTSPDAIKLIPIISEQRTKFADWVLKQAESL